MNAGTGEHRTDTFLLPGQQQFCVKPWEIANLPKVNTAARLLPAPAPKGNTLDDDGSLVEDPFEGAEIGRCRVIRRLSPGSVKVLLAIREHPLEGSTLVTLRRLELPERLTAEIQAHAEWAARFRHPSLGRIFNCEVSDEGLFWVSEHSPGVTLGELTLLCRKLGKGLPVGLALAAVHEAALALGALHVPSGHPHGLLSDQSVAVSFDGTTRLEDVGMFKCISKQNAWDGVLHSVGPYLAPEQILSAHRPDPRCDVFSLGVLLYECLSGVPLPRSANLDQQVKNQVNAEYPALSSLNITLTRELDEVVAKAMNPDRAKRYPDSIAFAHALKAAASSFMWRSELRADFVGKLFLTRKRHEQVFLEECSPHRTATAPELELPIIEGEIVAGSYESPLSAALAQTAGPLPESPLAVDLMKAASTPSRGKTAGARLRTATNAQRRRLARVAFVAAVLAGAAWASVVLPDLAPPVRVEPIVSVPTPMPAPAVEAVAQVDEAPAEAPTETVEPRAVTKPVKKSVRKAKRRRAAEALPDAPWLMPKRARR